MSDLINFIVPNLRLGMPMRWEFIELFSQFVV